jgi:hypothetical protein
MLPLGVENQPHDAIEHFRGRLFIVLLMMLRPTQELEPPANTARFIANAPWSSIAKGPGRAVRAALMRDGVARVTMAAPKFML